MERLFAFASIAALGLGIAHAYKYASQKRMRRQTAERLEVWESEGGAVRSAGRRSGVQTAPQHPRKPSPRTDA